MGRVLFVVVLFERGKNTYIHNGQEEASEDGPLHDP